MSWCNAGSGYASSKADGIVSRPRRVAAVHRLSEWPILRAFACVSRRHQRILEKSLELLARRIDPPQSKAAVGLHTIKEHSNRHHQIDPVRRRQYVDEPRKILIGECRLAVLEELAHLWSKWHRGRRTRRTWRITADEAGQLCGKQHEPLALRVRFVPKADLNRYAPKNARSS